MAAEAARAELVDLRFWPRGRGGLVKPIRSRRKVKVEREEREGEKRRSNSPRELS